MKRLIALILLAGIAYGGWIWWQSANNPTIPKISNLSSSNPKLSLQNQNQVLGRLESVLGSSIENGVETLTALVDQVANPDQAPIINKAIENFQSELKQLPEDQVKKIQYNYCKGIVKEYESSGN